MIDGSGHKIQHNLFRTRFAHHIGYVPLDDSDVRCYEKMAQFTGVLLIKVGSDAISFKVDLMPFRPNNFSILSESRQRNRFIYSVQAQGTDHVPFWTSEFPSSHALIPHA
jgi:hypothetical protein